MIAGTIVKKIPRYSTFYGKRVRHHLTDLELFPADRSISLFEIQFEFTRDCHAYSETDNAADVEIIDLPLPLEPTGKTELLQTSPIQSEKSRDHNKPIRDIIAIFDGEKIPAIAIKVFDRWFQVISRALINLSKPPLLDLLPLVSLPLGPGYSPQTKGIINNSIPGRTGPGLIQVKTTRRRDYGSPIFD